MTEKGVHSSASHVEQWWNITTAATYLSVSVAFLRKAVRLKRIPFARAGAKALRFRKSDLDRWLTMNDSCGEIADGGRVQ